MLVFRSDAESCAVCEHAVEGAVIDGRSYPGGWHCDVNDCAGTVNKAREQWALCRIDRLWEESED